MKAYTEGELDVVNTHLFAARKAALRLGMHSVVSHIDDARRPIIAEFNERETRRKESNGQVAIRTA